MAPPPSGTAPPAAGNDTREEPPVSEPAAGPPAAKPAKPAELTTLDKYLVAGIENQATTIYMFPGACITYRVGNKLLKVPNTTLNPGQTMAIALEILPNYVVEQPTAETKKVYLDRVKSLDFSYSVQGLARFRVNLFRQRGSLAFAMRVIPHDIPLLSSYQLPDDFLQSLKGLRGGLWVIHGRGRGGKSAFLASIVEHLNATQNRLVTVLEPTIQFSHRNNLCLVTQREIGSDMNSIEQGIDEALRQDQDILFVDELNSPESFDKVMEAVVKGMTTFVAMGTPDVEKTIRQLLGFKPQNRQLDLVNDLMTHLRALLSTELTIDPAGRRTVTVQYHPANLVNSVLLSKRTELEQKSSQKSMLHEFDSSSSVDQSWFDSE